MPGDQDRRRREVEQLRRTLLSVRARLESERLAAGEADRAVLEGTRPFQRQLGWLVEPDQPEPAGGGEPQPATPFEAPRRTLRAWLLIAPAVTLAAGVVLGFALGSARAGREPAGAAAARSPATQPAPVASASVVVRPFASSACLETATRGDELVELLVTNNRDRVPDLLVAYTVASRQCRKDASP